MRDILASGQGTTISTITPLTGWLTLVKPYQLLLFWAKPIDPAMQIQLYVECAEDDQPDTAVDQPLSDPGKQVSSEVGPPVVRSKYRLSAFSVVGATHPSTTINWGIVGITSAPIEVRLPGT